jgi:1-phosphofructokinase
MTAPELEVVNPRGAGDAMTGALAAMVAQRRDRVDAVRLAVAAGALNVTRHGLATGLRDAIDQLAERVAHRAIRERSVAR